MRISAAVFVSVLGGSLAAQTPARPLLKFEAPFACPHGMINPKAPAPPYPKSAFITDVQFGKIRMHKGEGDMWPITWAADDNLYGGAGDNNKSPMNFWRIEGNPIKGPDWPGAAIYLVDNLPIDPKIYCRNRPHVNWRGGVKPASLLSINGTLYFAVELMNYGESKEFRRQQNVSCWIITSMDFGKTWNREATPQDFFTGRLSSPHFIQFGKDYAGARDYYVYAYFPAGDDGNSYWDNADYLLLGRVPVPRILERSAWEFLTGFDQSGEPQWNKDDREAKAVFRYPKMTGENHVSYNPGLKRYLMGNFSFIDRDGTPRPYHQGFPGQAYPPTQLTLYEAPEPWGPWSVFHRDDDWGTWGDYQPSFPTKWMSPDGRLMFMVSAGSHDDYNFVFQRVRVTVAEPR